MPITINGSTGISGVDGSAATPALQGGDTNTGIVFGTDTVGVSTGGVQRTTVDSSGRLLVGVGSATANGGVLELSGGITFPATAVAASNANTLDDYEEGTFTPTYAATGGSAGSAAYSSDGKYIKIGNVVTAWGDVTLTNKGSWSSVVILGGLPFTAAAVRQNLGSCWFEWVALAAQTFYQTRIGPSEPHVTFPKITNNGSTSYLGVPELSNTSTMRFTISYTV